MAALTSLGGVSIERFLAEYWQKKPLLIRNLIPEFDCPVDANDLAGLSLEEEVESRIVYKNLDGRPWQLQQGPFEREQLSQLPDKDWTLLVQGLDHWVPECSDILDHFRFIPNWQIDDIMASFAPPGGGVGPHYDHYDVFLLQAQGERRWQIGPECDVAVPSLPGTPLRIIENMSITEDWVLHPGDCLYLPPRVAHNGIALSNCITLSIGFRSPRVDELISSFADHFGQKQENQSHFYHSPKYRQNPGEITSSAIISLQSRLQALLEDPQEIAKWFGEFTTTPKHEGIVCPRPEEDKISGKDVPGLLSSHQEYRWNEGSRYTYSNHEQTIVLNVDGASYSLQPALLDWVKLLCKSNQIDPKTLQILSNTDVQFEILSDLINRGSLILEKES